jgi:hypothetical protein
METDAIQAAMLRKYGILRPLLDEKAYRLCAAAEASALGRGGVTRVATAAGLSRTTVHLGLRELGAPLAHGTPAESRRIRRPGAGRKALAEKDPALRADLDRLVDPLTRGDPMSPLRWTCKSTTRLATALRDAGHRVSQHTVWSMLSESGYSMQSNRKTREGSNHADRDAQFGFISTRVEEFLAAGQPVISVDTKKKELVGEFRNGGREWQRKGQPVEVNVHDFVDKELGKAIPYGVYDIGRNKGWVSVGITHDTAEFAVETIRRWWRTMGERVYPGATRLLITADGGGSNGYRVRLWKIHLQKLADELAMSVHVCHFPPGTSKWNKIEHRMFCHITENWRGRPLSSRAAIVDLIGNTRTQAGLEISAALDENHDEAGTKVPDEELARILIEPYAFHGEWNYQIRPTASPKASS